MLEARRFENLKQAEFAAWLTDSYAFEDVDSKYFVVLAPSEARDRIKSLVREGKYDIAARYSEVLLTSPKFTEEERSRSIRVTFPEYAILLDEAFRQNVSLNEVLSKRVAADLEGKKSEISRNEGMNQEKLSMLNNAFKTWIEKPEKESSTASSYTPMYGFADNIPIEALKRMIIEIIIETGPKDVTRETVEAFLRVGEPVLDKSDLLDSIDVVIERGEKSGLVIDVLLTVTFNVQGRMDKRLRQFDEEIISKLLSMFHDVEEYEDECNLTTTVSILSAKVQLAGGKIFVENVPTTWDESTLKQKLVSKLTEKLNEERLQGQVMDALEKNDMNTVAALTRRLEVAKRKREVVQFAIETIVDIVHRSQVVSFRAPDVVIRAWEAYGNPDLGATPIEKKSGEGHE